MNEIQLFFSRQPTDTSHLAPFVADVRFYYTNLSTVSNINQLVASQRSNCDGGRHTQLLPRWPSGDHSLKGTITESLHAKEVHKLGNRLLAFIIQTFPSLYV